MTQSSTSGTALSPSVRSPLNGAGTVELPWQRSAQCRGLAAEIFYPDADDRHTRRRQEDAAKRVCIRCPVMAACREHALNLPEAHGIWGALTARERNRVRRIRSEAFG